MLTGEPDKRPGRGPVAARPSTPARSASPGSRSCPRKGSTAGSCSTPSSPGAAATGWTIEAGPLIEFRPAALPDWIWLWEGDQETISGFVTEFVRQVVQRYRGKVPLWHVVHRPASQEILGLSEEEQIRITARADPGRPAGRPVGPAQHRHRPALGRMDELQPLPARPASPLRLSAPVGPGDLQRRRSRSPRATPAREATSATSSSSPGCWTSTRCSTSRSTCPWRSPRRPAPTRRPTRAIQVDVAQWPAPPDEALQSTWGARWLALARRQAVRPLGDLAAGQRRLPHVYPHGGLFRADNTPKPIFPWLQSLRQDVIA